MTAVDAIARLGVDIPIPRRRPVRPCGVYLLVRRGAVIYVGTTTEIETRVACHLNGVPGKHEPKEFDRVIWIPLPRSDIGAYEGALIRALRPPLNERAPALCGRDLEVLARLGLPPHDEVAAQAAFRRQRYSPRPHTRGPRPDYLKRAAAETRARNRSKRAQP